MSDKGNFSDNFDDTLKAIITTFPSYFHKNVTMPSEKIIMNVARKVKRLAKVFTFNRRYCDKGIC